MRLFRQRDYLEAQCRAILSPDNLWFAGQALGRPPTPNEAAIYFIACGAADRFRAEHRDEYYVEVEDLTASPPAVESSSPI